jgi:hypothetical protein
LIALRARSTLPRGTAIVLRPYAIARHCAPRTKALAGPATTTLSAEPATHARPALPRESAPRAAAEPTAALAHACDAFPRLRLLIRREDRDRVSPIVLRLLAHAIHLRTQLLHTLTHLRARS